MATASRSPTTILPLTVSTEQAEATVLAEVVEASTSLLVAQCWERLRENPPAFGSLVKVVPPRFTGQWTASPSEYEDPFADESPAARQVGSPDGTIYAVVYSAETMSAQPGRRASAFQKTREELRQEQPQIFELLRTDFTALPVGFVRAGRLCPQIPPRPANLHDGVEECSDVEEKVITGCPEVLEAILRGPEGINADSLVVALLERGYTLREADRGFLVAAGKTLASLLRSEPGRLLGILRRIESATR